MKHRILFVFLVSGCEFSMNGSGPDSDRTSATAEAPRPSVPNDDANRTEAERLRRLTAELRELDGIAEYEDGFVLVVSQSAIATETCHGHDLSYEFDGRADRATWKCAGVSGGFDMSRPLDLTLRSGAVKSVVEPYKLCGENWAEIIISADRTEVSVRCPNTGATYPIAEGEFARYVIPVL